MKYCVVVRESTIDLKFMLICNVCRNPQHCTHSETAVGVAVASLAAIIRSLSWRGSAESSKDSAVGESEVGGVQQRMSAGEAAQGLVVGKQTARHKKVFTLIMLLY